jgi:hypothetical protein
MVLLQGETSEIFEWLMVNRVVGNPRNQKTDLIDPVIRGTCSLNLGIVFESAI